MCAISNRWKECHFQCKHTHVCIEKKYQLDSRTEWGEERRIMKLKLQVWLKLEIQSVARTHTAIGTSCRQNKRTAKENIVDWNQHSAINERRCGQKAKKIKRRRKLHDQHSFTNRFVKWSKTITINGRVFGKVNNVLLLTFGPLCLSLSPYLSRKN